MQTLSGTQSPLKVVCSANTTVLNVNDQYIW